MSIFYANPASYITLSSQLDDGADSMPKVVKATVRSKTGSILLANQLLTHVGSGLFTYSGYQMPNESLVVVQYFVYNADGVTLDSTFTVDADTFLRAADVGFSSGGGGGTVSGTYVILDEYIVEVDNA
jgi:hypothetical protein